MKKLLDRWSPSEIYSRRFAIGSDYDSPDWCRYEDVEQLQALNAELLEALKRYVVLLDIGGRWTLEDQNTARAVIAKAEGEQP